MLWLSTLAAKLVLPRRPALLVSMSAMAEVARGLSGVSLDSGESSCDRLRGGGGEILLAALVERLRLWNTRLPSFLTMYFALEFDIRYGFSLFFPFYYAGASEERNHESVKKLEEIQKKKKCATSVKQSLTE